MLRHPEIFYTGRDVLAELESANNMLHICSSCWKMSVLNVKETGSLLIEENFVDEMLGELELVADIPSK
jgi:hypothetical protein